MNDYIVSVKDTAHQKMTLCFLSALHYNEYVRAVLIVFLDAQQGMIYMYTRRTFYWKKNPCPAALQRVKSSHR